MPDPTAQQAQQRLHQWRQLIDRIDPNKGKGFGAVLSKIFDDVGTQERHACTETFDFAAV